MADDETATEQLRVIAWLDSCFTEQEIDYWIFGGWAVDLHLHRVTRQHADVDLAVWQVDLARVAELLGADGWARRTDLAGEGYMVYERRRSRIEVVVLDRDEDDTVYTPLEQGRGDWPPGSFGDDLGEVRGVHARVVGRRALVEDKSGPRLDPVAAGKDRADVALLTATDPDRLR